MRVIVCGAGRVGSSIAAYLAEEDNDVTLIDTEASLISQINETLDVTGIVGFAAHPDVLEKAGAQDADMIIAATQEDEVNMVACQVAHSLFDLPKKVARVREETYLAPEWANLFSRDHMPIDYVISPESEVAKAIANRIRVPGAFNIIPLADNKVQLVSVLAKTDCPLINTPLRHLTNLFPDLSIEILAIIRGQKRIIPSSEDEICPGDEVYFVTASDHLQRAMAAFGCKVEESARRIIIVGCGNIGLQLAKNIQNNYPGITARVIENNFERAQYVSQQLDKTIVLHGDGLSREILDEANVGLCEAVIAVTDHDETNVLVSLLSKEYGCERAITLINNPAYTPIVSSLGVDAIVSPRAITVSTILQHIRKGRIRSVHSLRDGFAEVIELVALDTSAVINKPLKILDFPEGVILGAIVRDEEIIAPRPETVIKPNDLVILLASHEQVRKVEQFFAVSPEYF